MKFFALVLILLLSSLHADTSLEKVSLQLHWKYQFEFAGFIAAKEKGFYRDEGLDVTLKEYKTGMNVINEVLSKRAQYGVYNSSTLLEYLQGKPIVLIASFFKRSALVLITQKNIHSPKDLIGKKVMSSTKSDFLLNFKPYFDEYGVTINDIKLVKESYSVHDFAQRKIDAMSAFISDQPYKLDKLGVKYNILDPSNDDLFVLQEELFTSKNEIKNHPQRVIAFKNASIKGWKYALTHKEELAKIIHKKYAPNIPVKTLMYEAKAVDKLILPNVYDIGSIDRSFLHKQMKLFKNNFHIGNAKSLNDFIFKEKLPNLQFSQIEAKYIKENPKISVCIHPDFFPIDGYEHGKFTGIMSDVFSHISDETGFEFVPVVAHTQNDLLTNLEQKKCKILSLVPTENINFPTIIPTQAICRSYFTLLSRLDRSFVAGPSFLKGKVLLVQQKAFKNYLNYLYPYLNIEIENDKNKMVKKISDGRAYAIITIDEEADYFIDKYGYGKLKINGFLARDNMLHGSIGIQKDEPVLYTIVQKVLKHMPKKEIKAIANSWKLSRYHEQTDYSLLWTILAVGSAIFFLMLYYQKKLKKFNKVLGETVDAKTKELREINELLEKKVQRKLKELVKKDEILTAQSKQAVMGEMISMIAHQWRQPLNTITLQISNLQLKNMMGQKLEHEEIMKTLGNISDSILYLSETIDDFKSYFHPNKDPENMQLEELLNKTIKFILPRVKAKKIVLDTECDSSIYVYVYTNELIQVLLNILNNAIDAYSESDTKEHHIYITCKLIEKEVLINISDQAGGIADEYLSKLFEPYFSTKGKNGTGLGLYMSKMIIEKQFGGHIEVKTSHLGTTFIIRFPRSI